MKSAFPANKGKVEISRFKGLGEMPARYLKDTTMDPKKRASAAREAADARTSAPTSRQTVELVESLMGRKPELRFEFIQKNAKFARDLDV